MHANYKQLHIGTCNGCENSESVIACNYRTRSNYSNILIPRTASFSILFPSKFIEHAEFRIF